MCVYVSLHCLYLIRSKYYHTHAHTVCKQRQYTFVFAFACVLYCATVKTKYTNFKKHTLRLLVENNCIAWENNTQV